MSSGNHHRIELIADGSYGSNTISDLGSGVTMHIDVFDSILDDNLGLVTFHLDNDIAFTIEGDDVA